MKEFSRRDRLGDQIKREIAEILSQHIKDPGVGFVTIMDVELSKDLKYAKVFYSALGSEEERAVSAKALDKTRGAVQSELARRIRVRSVPILSYHFDSSLDYGDHIDRLLDQIKTDDAGDEEEDG